MSHALAAWISWRRLSVAGMGAMLAVLLAAALLPDPSSLSADELSDLAARRPALLRIARVLPAGRLLGSNGLLAVPAVLAVAISWNLVQRLKGHRRRVHAPAGRFTPQREWASAHGAQDAAAAAAAWLERHRYRVARQDGPGGEVSLVGRRGGVGFWGSIAFHVGLVVALLAVCATLALEWRGEVRLIERQQVALDAPGAIRIDRRGPLAPALGHVVLDFVRFEPTYQDDRFPLDYRAELLVLDPAGALRRETIRVNDPLQVDSERFILKAYGIAPVIDLDRDGERIAGGPAALSIRRGNEDVLEIPRTGGEPRVRWFGGVRGMPGGVDQLRIRWFGDMVREGRSVSSRSDLPRNPALGLELVRSGALAGSLLLKRGETGTLGPYRVAFPEVRYWVDLGVDHDPGATVLLVALVLASLGLAVRFWDHDREIRVRVAGAGSGALVAASARSRYFPAMIARELESLEAG